MFRPPEHIDYVDGTRAADGGVEIRPRLFAEDFAGRRIHGDDAIAELLQRLRDVMTGAILAVRQAENGDGARAPEQRVDCGF